MATNPVELYNEFLRITESGDEAAARKFLSEHMSELPEDIQDEIRFAAIEDAILKRAEQIQGDVALQEAGVQAIQDLEKAKRDLENDAKIDELKGELKPDTKA